MSSPQSRAWESPRKNSSRGWIDRDRELPPTVSTNRVQKQFHSSRVMSPKAPSRSNRGRHSISSSPTSASDQLTNLKNQWNVERDIPTGTVRNSPFVPKSERVTGPPPQLAQQKKQWDTSGIPRGSVAARAMSMEGVPDHIESPSRKGLRVTTQFQDRRSASPSPRFRSPSSTGTKSPYEKDRRFQTNAARDSFSKEPINSSPYNKSRPMPIDTSMPTSYRGSLIENSFVPSKAPTSPRTSHASPSKWEPSREIPAGTVKGKMNKLFANNMVDNSRGRDKGHQEDLQFAEDPWIIPAKASASPQVFSSHWGEAVPTKSSESEDWENPASDWLHGVNSNQSTPRQDQGDKFFSSKGSFSDPIRVDLLDEDDSLAGNRDADVLNLARQKKLSNEDANPFGTTNARDSDILQAAKEKAMQTAQKQFLTQQIAEPAHFAQSAFGNEESNAETFDGDLFSDIKSEDQNLEYAFPSAPFEEKAFADFKEFDANPKGELGTSEECPILVNDVQSVELEQKNEAPRTETNEIRISMDRGSKTNAASIKEPKKQKKGFFGKLFRGGRKGRTSTERGKNRARPKNAPSPLEAPMALEGPDQDVIEFKDGQALEENQEGGESPRFQDRDFETSQDHARDKKKGDDETIISEMTLPTVFKDSSTLETEALALAKKKDRMETVKSLRLIEETLPEVAPVIDLSENEGVQILHIAKEEKNLPPTSVAILPPPPPPPPPGPPPRTKVKTERFSTQRTATGENIIANVWLQEEESGPVTLKHDADNSDESENPLDRGEPPSASKQSTGAKSSVEGKLARATRAYQQSGLGQSSIRNPPKYTESLPKDNDSVITGDSASVSTGGYSSVFSNKTNDSSSAQSDMRVLRSILRRPRKGASYASATATKAVSASYDESNITDPMQRAGLRLLSAAIIPIQTEVRRFLAMRRALTRMWALIVIQTYTRRWIARKKFLGTVGSVVAIQSAFRGNVTRNELAYKRACAVAIQANWRCFFTRLTYQFDLLDIIIVQSVWRRKMASRRVNATRDAIRDATWNRSATIIQTKWRSYDCTMNYLHYLADVLMVQSTIRRFLVRRRVRKIKNDAATKIQSVWRGFVCYADYMFSITDIVVTQKVARRWLAIRTAEKLRHTKQTEAAIMIQKTWRCFVDETEFVVMKYEHHAAQTIQTYWRRYWCFSNFVIALDCSIQIQAAYRGFKDRSNLRHLHDSATRIQSIARRNQAIEERSHLDCLKNLRIVGEMAAERQSTAAVAIQSIVRGRQTRIPYNFYRAALKIQTFFRAEKAKRDVLVLRGEFLAASLIQSAWRGFVCYTDYIFTVSDVISAQKMVRRFLVQKKYGQQLRKKIEHYHYLRAASTSIQKVCRGFIARQRYWYTLGCTMQIQSWMRGRLAVLRVQKVAWARLKLQSFARMIFGRQEYLQRKFILMLVKTADQERTKRVAAMVIQDGARDFLVQKRRDDAARIIQRFFLMVKVEVDRLVKARKKRKNWRKKSKKRSNKIEDALLEDAWASAINVGSFECGSNENESMNAQLTKVELQSGMGKNVKRDTKPRNPCAERSKNSERRGKTRAPLSHSGRPTMMVRLQLDDEQSEFSGLTASTGHFIRAPVSRMRRKGAREMDEDLELEEAFIDAEITSAKERRMAFSN